MRRVVEERDVLVTIETSDQEAVDRKLNRQMRRDLILSAVRALLERSATPQGAGDIPALVGMAEAAEILGTKKPYVTRLRKQGVLTPIEQLQSGPVFRREDVERHAKQLEQSRKARTERREERERAEEAG